MEIKEVFEPVLNFIKNLQKKDKEPASKQAAKDRLKLVLMQDRASVSPDFFDIMKKEIIDVIKKYIEIDEDALEVELTRGLEAGLEGPALYANIPIKNVKPMAPKVDEDDGEDHLEDEEEAQIAEIENAINDATEGAPLTEEQADAVADAILTHIEEKAAEEDEPVKEEKAIEEEPVVEEKTEAAVEEKKAPAKKTTKKSTTTKKKTTSSKTKKKEE
ncbi:MAG: cell division topological specificity factor MinE [Clostridia bacterium]|nr:cell division topological specificity factor MinE [Clostridia bacterium]